MEKYRKKPVLVEAEQWFEVALEREAGKGKRPLYRLSVDYYKTSQVYGKYKCKHCNKEMNAHGWISNLEGGHIVCPGDWIIKGIKGEMYSCKPDIFEATYEKVED